MKVNSDPICKYIVNNILKKVGPKEPTIKEIATQNPKIMTAAQALAIEAAALVKHTIKK